MLENIKRKFAYIYLQATFAYVYAFAYVYSFIFKRSHNKPQPPVRKIAALWNNPPDLNGSDLRLGYWKKYFEAAGYQYDNFYIGSVKEMDRMLDNGTWAEKYDFYRINLLRRFKQFLKLKDYDVVWIHRAFVMSYPLKQAFLERCIKRMVGYVVVDSTDGQDYEINPELVIDTMRQADRITVGFDYLKDFFSKEFDDVVQFNWTIPNDNYIVKTNYEITDLPVIGWMGSPGNFYHVKDIEDQLQAVARVKPFKFVYICREDQDLNIPGTVIERRPYADDYFELISNFDIGIAPCTGETITHKGKIAMKHQEFMISAVPQVCSSVAISEYVENDKDVLIAQNLDDWTARLLTLLDDAKLRERLGKNSREVFLQHYTYESEFPKVLAALTKFD